MATEKEASQKSLTHHTIFFVFTLLILLYDSILILFSGFKKGILKKEVLSKKSKVGFDFKIIVK
jgi:hypothetical protein